MQLDTPASLAASLQRTPPRTSPFQRISTAQAAPDYAYSSDESRQTQQRAQDFSQAPAQALGQGAAGDRDHSRDYSPPWAPSRVSADAAPDVQVGRQSLATELSGARPLLIFIFGSLCDMGLCLSILQSSSEACKAMLSACWAGEECVPFRQTSCQRGLAGSPCCLSTGARRGAFSACIDSTSCRLALPQPYQKTMTFVHDVLAWMEHLWSHLAELPG